MVLPLRFGSVRLDPRNGLCIPLPELREVPGMGREAADVETFCDPGGSLDKHFESVEVVWWYHAFYVLPKLEYNRWHPYTSWIPISCYILLRNFLPELRVWSLGFFSWCGKITLETYICQFHLWLGSSKLPNAQPSKLLVLVPGYPFVNFVLSTAVYIGVSKRVFSLTDELGRACLPQTTGELGLLVIFLILFFGTILAAVYMISSQMAGL